MSTFGRYTWGNNEHGRLGHTPEEVKQGSRKLVDSRSIFISGANPPKQVDALSNENVIQVSCGAHHTVRKSRGEEIKSSKQREEGRNDLKFYSIL